MAGYYKDRTGNNKVFADCAQCGEVHRLYARGLCNHCYVTLSRDGRLSDYPTASELDHDDYCWLRSFGIPQEEAAHRVGILPSTSAEYEHTYQARRRALGWKGPAAA